MTVPLDPTTQPRPQRLAGAIGLSAAAHLLFGLLVYFDVMGLGGGFGIGIGPGFGIGSGGGAGLGEEKRREIFSIENIPDFVQRPIEPDSGEKLAELLKPERPRPIVMPHPAKPKVQGTTTIKAPVVQFARPAKPLGATGDLSQRLQAAGSGSGGLGGGGGGGMGISLGSLGDAFGKYVGGLRKTGLDIAIVVDSTGSMQNVIDEMKKRLDGVVVNMQRLVPTARVGAVAYRDRDDGKTASAPRQSEDYVTRWSDLTFNARKVQTFLSGIVAEGGGDWEEAVKEGLETAMTKLKWRADAKKVILLVGSSPPHKSDTAAINALIASWRDKNGIVSTVDVSERLHEEHEKKLHRWLYGEELQQVSSLPEFYAEVKQSFSAIARAGGGEPVSLGQDQALMRHLLVLAFGRQWEKDVRGVAKGL